MEATVFDSNGPLGVQGSREEASRRDRLERQHQRRGTDVWELLGRERCAIYSEVPQQNLLQLRQNTFSMRRMRKKRCLWHRKCCRWTGECCASGPICRSNTPSSCWLSLTCLEAPEKAAVYECEHGSGDYPGECTVLLELGKGARAHTGALRVLTSAHEVVVVAQHVLLTKVCEFQLRKHSTLAQQRR